MSETIRQRDYTSKFKSAHNHYKLKTLFFEYNGPGEDTLYTLSNEDYTCLSNGKTYPSVRRLYLELQDPTEYRVATELFGGYDHWQLLVNAKWFGHELDKWRKELELKMRSEALGHLIQSASLNSKDSFAARKFIIEGGWKPDKKGEKKVKQEVVDNTFSDKRLKQDAERLLSGFTTRSN